MGLGVDRFGLCVFHVQLFSHEHICGRCIDLPLSKPSDTLRAMHEIR